MWIDMPYECHSIRIQCQSNNTKRKHILLSTPNFHIWNTCTKIIWHDILKDFGIHWLLLLLLWVFHLNVITYGPRMKSFFISSFIVHVCELEWSEALRQPPTEHQKTTTNREQDKKKPTSSKCHPFVTIPTFEFHCSNGMKHLMLT